MFTMNNYGLVRNSNLETGNLFGQNHRAITTATKSCNKLAINIKAMLNWYIWPGKKILLHLVAMKSSSTYENYTFS